MAYHSRKQGQIRVPQQSGSSGFVPCHSMEMGLSKAEAIAVRLYRAKGPRKAKKSLELRKFSWQVQS